MVRCKTTCTKLCTNTTTVQPCAPTLGRLRLEIKTTLSELKWHGFEKNPVSDLLGSWCDSVHEYAMFDRRCWFTGCLVWSVGLVGRAGGFKVLIGLLVWPLERLGGMGGGVLKPSGMVGPTGSLGGLIGWAVRAGWVRRARFCKSFRCPRGVRPCPPSVENHSAGYRQIPLCLCVFLPLRNPIYVHP